MRSFSHKFLIILFFVIILFSLSNKAYCQINQEQTQKIFSLGRSVGASYFELTNICDKARFKPYSDFKKEYSTTFQDLNLMDILLEDMDASKESYLLLGNLRTNFYNALKDQDLNEISLLCIRDAYVLYYESLAKEISNKYSSEGSWLFTLGFYSSFQLESLNSSTDSKLLLSGFDKILSSNPFSSLPVTVSTSLKIINNLDKIYVNNKDLEALKQNFIKITEYFGGCKSSQKEELKELLGTWQGTLIDPENERHKIKLIVYDEENIKMDIDGIAQNILISDVKLIDNYFTFLFKPFGNEKLYIRFNAKISNDTFAGEVVDALGQKGNWLLSKF